MMSRFRVVPVVSEKVYRNGVCMIFIYFVNSTELCVRRVGVYNTDSYN